MFGNIAQIIEMKKKAEELKKKLEAIVITEKHNGITIDINGNRKILAIHIETEAMGDKARLEEQLTTAINKAMEAAEKSSMGELGAMAGGMQGLMGLLGKQ